MAGTPRERGLAYGEAAAPLIREAAARWKARAGDRCDEVLHALIDRTEFVTTALQLTPDLVDEIAGIAHAAAVDERLIWALNLLDEDWWVRRRLDAGPGCSALGLQGGGDHPTLLAQNMDLPDWVDELQVVLDIGPHEDSPRVLAPAYAGIVATNAMNEDGIGVCVNTLSQLPTSSRGLPVAFFIRHVAAQRTFDAATAVVRELPHASGQNYLIGSANEIADLECGAGVVTSCPLRDGRVAHTNHPLGAPPPEDDGVVANSGLRLDALDRALRVPGPLTRADAEQLLASAPLCRQRGTGDGAFTFYSVVMELSGTPALHLTDGPPGQSHYRTFCLG